VLGLAAIAIVAPFLWIFRGAISPTMLSLYRCRRLLPSCFRRRKLGKVFAQVRFAQFALIRSSVATSITLLFSSSPRRPLLRILRG